MPRKGETKFPYNCSTCNELIINPKSLYRHRCFKPAKQQCNRRVYTSKYPMKCPTCNELITNKFQKYSHQCQVITTITPENVGRIIAAEISLLQDEREEVHRRFPILCNRCRKIIGDRYQLSHHRCLDQVGYKLLSANKRLQRRIQETLQLEEYILNNPYEELEAEIYQLISNWEPVSDDFLKVEGDEFIRPVDNDVHQSDQRNQDIEEDAPNDDQFDAYKMELDIVQPSTYEIEMSDDNQLKDEQKEVILPAIKSHISPFLHSPSIFQWNTYEIPDDSSWDFWRKNPHKRWQLLVCIMNDSY